MQHGRASTFVVIGAMVLATIIAPAAGGWSLAERQSADFDKDARALTELAPQETKSLVSAICDACEEFDDRVDCYTLCPDIDAKTNEFRSTSLSWRTDC